MNILDFVGAIFEPAVKLIDDLHTSGEEKLAMKAKMLEIQAGILSKASEYEKQLLEAQSSIVMAEVKSDSWVTANWRPVTMLTFVAAIMAYWFGLTPDTLTQSAVDSMFTLVQIGIGGYVVGRSAEKAAAVLKK